MASKMAAKIENPIYWLYFAVISKQSSHFCYYAFSTSLRELLIIKDVLNIYIQQKHNNECMLSTLCTTCFESKAADVG